MKKKKKLVFLGASTGFEEISNLIYDINDLDDKYEIVALLDDNPEKHGQTLHGIPIEGPLEKAHEYPEVSFVYAIGSYKNQFKRYEILERLGLEESRFVTLIHPNTKIYPSAKIGPGSIIHSGTVIGNDTQIDAFTIITFNSVIGPYCQVGSGAMITTLVVVLTGSSIGPYAFIGSHSCIGENLQIGPGAMVGMGSVVFRDVSPGAFVLGNPAKKLYERKVPEIFLKNWQKMKNCK
jgi:sugar O-acyltransferase (sialic acid O-acetyltransferase NeuD family)